MLSGGCGGCKLAEENVDRDTRGKNCWYPSGKERKAHNGHRTNSNLKIIIIKKIEPIKSNIVFNHASTGLFTKLQS